MRNILSFKNLRIDVKKGDDELIIILQHSKDKISEFTGRINYIYIFHLSRFNKMEINKLNSLKL